MSKPRISSEGSHIAEALLEAMKSAAERGDVDQVVAAVRGWIKLEWKIRPNSREHRAIRYSILKASDVARDSEEGECTKILNLAELLKDLGWLVQEAPVDAAAATRVDPPAGRDLQARSGFAPPPPPPPLPSALSRATTIQHAGDDLELGEEFRDLLESPSLPSFETKTGAARLLGPAAVPKRRR